MLEERTRRRPEQGASSRDSSCQNLATYRNAAFGRAPLEVRRRLEDEKY